MRWLVWTWVLCVIAGLSGCLQEASQTCANGSVCPSGLLCVDTAHTTVGGRICAAGTCGNGVLDPGEVCDDGNNHSGDGCPADCTQPCGDGVLDPGEVCDDGNNIDGDGCSADCQSLDRKFDVAPAVVNLTTTEGDPLPDAVAVDVHLEFAGDSLLVGYPPGVAEPGWLSITEGAPSDETIELALRATDTLQVGERSTSVRLTLGHANSTSVESFDLPVTYTVQPSDLAIAASPTSLAFTAATDDGSVPAQTVALTFNGDAAAVVSAPSWLTVTRADPMTFTATVSDTSFAAGTTLSDDVVFATTRNLLQRAVTVHVDYQITAPPALAISTAPTTLTFTAFAGRSPPAPQAVAVTFTGATLELTTPPPAWLTVTAPAAPVTSPASFPFAVNTTALPAGQVSTADLVFQTGRGLQRQTATVHVEYHVLAVPEVQYVAPYVGLADRGASLFLRGHGFATGTPLTVAIGDLHIGPITPDNDTQITLSYPPLPPGRYPVTVVDPPGTAPNDPALVIVDPPPFGYQVIASGGAWSRLVFDAERQAIYAIDPDNQQIGRFAYVHGAWTALAPTVLPALVDGAMAPDGGSLIAVTHVDLDEISLRDGLFTPVPRVSAPQGQFCNLFIGIAIPNHGQAFVLGGEPDATFGCALYTYGLLDHTLASSNANIANDLAAVSGDGSTVYSTTFSETTIYDARDGTSSATGFRDTISHISVSGDGSRAILNQGVFDRSFDLLGALPAQSTPFISRDATRAFVYVQDASGNRIDIYDLTRSIPPGGPVPLLKTVAVPDTACDFNLGVQMTTNLDDTVVFVAGQDRLLVVPVGP